VPDEPLGQAVGSMAVEPFPIALDQPHFNFTIRGELFEQLPPAEDGLSQPLEAFLAAYLHEHPLALHLTPHPPPPPPPTDTSSSPSSSSSLDDGQTGRRLGLFPALLLELGPIRAPVPAPDPPLKPLRSIEIEGMRLKEGRDGRMRASGRVRAIVDVPGFAGSQGVKLEVGYVRPDSPSPSRPASLHLKELVLILPLSLGILRPPRNQSLHLQRPGPSPSTILQRLLRSTRNGDDGAGSTQGLCPPQLRAPPSDDDGRGPDPAKRPLGPRPL